MQTHGMTAFAMSTIAAMPNASQYTQLDQYFSKKIDEISKLLLNHDDKRFSYFGLLGYDSVISHPKTIKTVFERLITEEQPFDFLDFIGRGIKRDKRFRIDLHRIVIDDIQIDYSDWTSKPDDSVENLLIFMSQDKRVVEHITQSIEQHPTLRRLTQYPHFYESKTLRQALLSNIHNYSNNLGMRDTSLELIETILKTPPFIENQVIIQSMRKGLRLKAEEKYDPTEFSRVVTLIRTHAKDSILGQLMEPLNEYRFIDEISPIEH